LILLHQLDFALSVSTTSFRGPVVRSNGQRAETGKLLMEGDLRQISDAGRVKKSAETQVFLTGRFYLRPSAKSADDLTPNLRAMHSHYERDPYPAAHEIEDVRDPSDHRPRRVPAE
jgi:hypothetical protein